MTAQKSTYRIINDLNLIIEYHSGNLDVPSYIKFKERTFKDPNFKTGLNYFIHFKNVTFIKPKENVHLLVEFIKKNASKFGKRKVAFITSTPEQVVATTIYKTMLADNEQDVTVFSTNENAFNWLTSNPLNTIKLVEIIKEIKREIGE